jgi:NAD/NADP transhydrogenase beta subunit
VPVVIVVVVAMAAMPHLFKLLTSLLGLAALFAVARNLLLEFRFGLVDALFALLVATVILGARSRGAGEQQDST